MTTKNMMTSSIPSLTTIRFSSGSRHSPDTGCEALDCHVTVEIPAQDGSLDAQFSPVCIVEGALRYEREPSAAARALPLLLLLGGGVVVGPPPVAIFELPSKYAPSWTISAPALISPVT